MKPTVFSLLDALDQYTLQEEDAHDLETNIRNRRDMYHFDFGGYIAALEEAEAAYEAYLVAVTKVYTAVARD